MYIHKRTQADLSLDLDLLSNLVFFSSGCLSLVATPMRLPAGWRRISLLSVRGFATVSPGSIRVPQTVIEKVVQRYAVDLPLGKAVKAGDYVMIRPEHVMTHDNTGPVISK